MDDIEGEVEVPEEEDKEEAALSRYEQLCALLQSDNKKGRIKAMAIIKRLYITNGGSVPIKKDSVIPVDISDVTNEELLNIIDNIHVHTNRTKKVELTSKAIDMVSDLVLAAAESSGHKSLSASVEQFKNDIMLKDAVVQTFLGKGVNPPPLLTFGVTLGAHISRAFRDIIAAYGKQMVPGVRPNSGERRTEETGDTPREPSHGPSSTPDANTNHG